jgi:hypothetical protein
MPKRHALFTTLLASTMVLATSLPSLAASNICDFYAYSDDSDPAGTNVRSGPGTSYDIVGVLKPETVEESYSFTPEFQVTAFDNGWFQIGDAHYGDYDGGGDKPAFKGPGWVSAKLVEFEIEDPNLRDAPSLDAKVILEMRFDTPWGLDGMRIQTIHACEGGFLDVTITNPTGATKRGWVTDLCGNQATTCS